MFNISYFLNALTYQVFHRQILKIGFFIFTHSEAGHELRTTLEMRELADFRASVYPRRLLEDHRKDRRRLFLIEIVRKTETGVKGTASDSPWVSQQYSLGRGTCVASLQMSD